MLKIQDEIGNYLVSTVELKQENDLIQAIREYIETTILEIKEEGNFETMIFKKENGEVDFNHLYCKRYLTEKEAIEGHKKAIEYAKENLIKKVGD